MTNPEEISMDAASLPTEEIRINLVAQGSGTVRVSSANPRMGDVELVMAPQGVGQVRH